MLGLNRSTLTYLPANAAAAKGNGVLGIAEIGTEAGNEPVTALPTEARQRQPVHMLAKL